MLLFADNYHYMGALALLGAGAYYMLISLNLDEGQATEGILYSLWKKSIARKNNLTI